MAPEHEMACRAGNDAGDQNAVAWTDQMTNWAGNGTDDDAGNDRCRTAIGQQAGDENNVHEQKSHGHGRRHLTRCDMAADGRHDRNHDTAKHKSGEITHPVNWREPRHRLQDI